MRQVHKIYKRRRIKIYKKYYTTFKLISIITRDYAGENMFIIHFSVYIKILDNIGNGKNTKPNQNKPSNRLSPVNPATTTTFEIRYHFPARSILLVSPVRISCRRESRVNPLQPHTIKCICMYVVFRYKIEPTVTKYRLYAIKRVYYNNAYWYCLLFKNDQIFVQNVIGNLSKLYV